MAREDDRILVTNDKDFALLAFTQRAITSGIILLRMPKLTSSSKGERLSRFLADRQPVLSGVLIVVGPANVRRRALPGGAVP